MKYFSNIKIAHKRRYVKDYFGVFLGYFLAKFNTLLLYMFYTTVNTLKRQIIIERDSQFFHITIKS
jgi:hypothetical protein